VNAVTACQPANPWLAHPARIDRIVFETAGVATYDLVFEDHALAAGFSFRPGQFNMLYLPGVGEVAISISGDPADASKVPHTIRRAGNVTNELAELGEGAVIGVRGPFGSNWPIAECESKDVILVAGGIGLAPLRSAIHELLASRDRFGSLTLLYGSRERRGTASASTANARASFAWPSRRISPAWGRLLRPAAACSARRSTAAATAASDRRDFATLQRAGFPMAETVSDHGRKCWKLATGANNPPLTFNWDEASPCSWPADCSNHSPARTFGCVQGTEEEQAGVAGCPDPFPLPRAGPPKQVATTPRGRPPHLLHRAGLRIPFPYEAGMLVNC